MPMDGRFTICNMAIEAGAKNGIIPPDKITEEYLKGRALRPYTFYESDADANYTRVLKYNVEDIEPTVAFPHLPENTKPISQVGNVKINQNPCLGTTYDKDETLEEVIYSKNYFEQLKKDAKYYLGLDYNTDPKYLEILDLYGEFLTINEGFVNTKTTDDIKLPAKIKQPKDIEKIHDKIMEVVKNGNLPDLFEFYGQIV